MARHLKDMLNMSNEWYVNHLVFKVDILESNCRFSRKLRVPSSTAARVL